MRQNITLEFCQNAYLSRSEFKSPHTQAAYKRAIHLFLAFLSDQHIVAPLPIQQNSIAPQHTLIEAFGAEDVPVFQRFSEWLLQKSYSSATIELRVAGVQNWFQFIAAQGWLPSEFSLETANTLFRKQKSTTPNKKKSVEPINLDSIVYYYDNLDVPKSFLKSGHDASRLEQWELIRLRNCALLHSLAESGGRISELLSLNIEHFREAQSTKPDVFEIEVRGKSGHGYHLRLKSSLSAIYAYLNKRNLDWELNSPLFISHDTRYNGSRMSRIVAWRVVRRAAQALGLGEVSPHDFRHWKASQLIRDKYPLHEVQELLGHRSIETVRALYAHLEPDKLSEQ